MKKKEELLKEIELLKDAVRDFFQSGACDRCPVKRALEDKGGSLENAVENFLELYLAGKFKLENNNKT